MDILENETEKERRKGEKRRERKGDVILFTWEWGSCWGKRK